MNKIIGFSFCLSVSIVCFSQQTPTEKDTLIQLNYPKRFVDKYVNYDVIKLTFSHGRSFDGLSSFGIGLSIKAQFLWPYSAFKESSFPIAWGIVAGSDKMTRKRASHIFSHAELMDVIPNNNIKASVQRTGYIGPTALLVIRPNSKGPFTILTGPSVNFNIFGNRLIERTEIGRNSKSDWKSVNLISIPYHIQLSYSPKQVLSFGINGSYDLRPRFKGDLNEIKQVNLGISLALIF